MNIKRNSIAVRYYAFLMHLAGDPQWRIEGRIDRISNLCQFVRALVTRTVITAVFLTLFAGLLSLLGYAAYKDPKGFFLIVVGVPASVEVMCLIVYGAGLLFKRKSQKPDGVIVSYIKAVKNCLCPLLTIERD